MPYDLTHTCSRCRRRTDLFYVRSVDEYLCEDCIMLLSQDPESTQAKENDE